MKRISRNLAAASLLFLPGAKAFSPWSLTSHPSDRRHSGLERQRTCQLDTILLMQSSREGEDTSAGNDSLNSCEGDDVTFQKLYDILCAKSTIAKNTVRLDRSSDGIRGVFINRKVSSGDTILRIPLSACIRDDQPPVWMRSEDMDPDISWATRSAAGLIDAQLAANTDGSSEAFKLWLSLMPTASYLRASLPIHWSETILNMASCTALELAVDSSFFSRAQAVQDLVDGLDHHKESQSMSPEAKQTMAENALDLVQTRTCRVVFSNDQPVRLLAPMFDMINHHPTLVNAEFILEEDSGEVKESFLVVRALCEIDANEQLYIDYGESARPDWKCLVSYGFIPAFEPGTPIGDGDHMAEVYVEGQRYTVGPDTVSEALVYAMAEAMGEIPSPDADVHLTPNIALRLAQRLAEAAFQVVLGGNSYGDDAVIESVEKETAESIISEQLAAALRWNQHRILMACSLGLRDWASKQL